MATKAQTESQKAMAKLNKAKRKRRKRRRVFRIFAITTLGLSLGIGAFFLVDYLRQGAKLNKRYVIEVGEPIQLQNFIREPGTKAVFSGDTKVFDSSKPGEYPVRIEVGMYTYTCKLLIVDVTAPVIEGVHDIHVEPGETVSYKEGVTATDDCDPNVELNVDATQVDYSKEGSYEIIYTATDASGNQTVEKGRLIVEVRNYTQEFVDSYGNQIIASILTDGMSDREKLTAIYNWIRSNVAYIAYSEKASWRKAAYEGMVLHKGDCFVYASTAKELLNLAGIKNMDIAKIPSDTRHYWNLVDIGEGWHHFDTCLREGNPDFNYVTDAQLMEYSNANGGTHNYDRSAYPFIQ